MLGLGDRRRARQDAAARSASRVHRRPIRQAEVEAGHGRADLEQRREAFLVKRDRRRRRLRRLVEPELLIQRAEAIARPRCIRFI
jgi:hypothetical protein